MKRDLRQLSNNQFDLVIIGGGIYGATAAWRAAIEGLTVALIDKSDFAAGSSSNTQKLLHGGIHEMRQFDRRRRHSQHERQRMLHLAPNLVKSTSCLAPLYDATSPGLVAKTASKFYDWIGRQHGKPADSEGLNQAVEMLSPQELKELLPGVKEDGLEGGARWSEVMCHNTERLIIAFLKTAEQHGAVLANYLRAVRFVTRNGNIEAIAVRDQLSGERFEIKTGEVFDCTAAWSNELLLGQEQPMPEIQPQPFVAGISALVRNIGPDDNCLVLQRKTVEEQVYLITPWKGHSIIGTEWFRYDGHPDHLDITRGQCLQLLENVNGIYPGAQLTLADVRFIYQGLMPGSGEDYWGTETIKKYRLQDYTAHGIRGVNRIFGVSFGKALYVVETLLMRVFSQIKRRPLADQKVLTGCVVGDMPNARGDLLKRWGERVDSTHLDHLLYNYGDEAEQLLMRADAGQRGGPIQRTQLLAAEVRHALSEEMAVKLSDVIFRRTDVGYFGKVSQVELTSIAEQMASVLHWSESRLVSEIQECRDRFPFAH